MADTKKPERAGAAPPSARKLPLLSVKFRHPVAIPGCPVMARTLTSGCEVPQGDGARCPQLFYDPDFRVIMIGELLIPCDGYSVESMIRARSAVAGAKS